MAADGGVDDKAREPNGGRPVRSGRSNEGRQQALAARPPEESKRHDGVAPKAGFGVVALCAAATDLEAVNAFFEHVPERSGLAFLVALHTRLASDGSLAEQLQERLHITVQEVTAETVVQPDTVFILPPDRQVTLENGGLQLGPPSSRPLWPVALDSFLHSLAEDQESKAICLLFSGAAVDGSLGLRSIKEKGGLVIVDSAAEASGMPAGAMAAGLADYTLSPEEMPQKVLEYVTLPNFQTLAHGEAPVISRHALQRIYLLLRAHTGHDFSAYKVTTISRRLARRMMVHRLEDVDAYVHYLRQHPGELTRLFHEFLIGVTHFFRDPEAFVSLQEKVIPALLEGRDPLDPVRIWVPACSTGEEAYTIAILLREEMMKRQAVFEVQIFATDLDAQAIDAGRAAVYPASIARHVSPERLTRFFKRQDDHSYEIRKEIRHMVIFAEQNLAKDPPFSRLDLVSCRNLLIYMTNDLQKRILGTFFYALKEKGFLFLGPSETLAEYADYYQVIDRRWRIFQRTGEWANARPDLDFSTAQHVALRPSYPVAKLDRKSSDHQQLVQRLLLDHFGAAGALIDKNYHLLFAYGPIDRYLRVAPGEARLNIVEMAREGLELELLTAVRAALVDGEEVVRKAVRVKTNGGHDMVNLTVKPASEAPTRAGLLLVLLEEVAPAAEADIEVITAAPDLLADDVPQVRALKQELQATRLYLQTTLEEMQVAYEELKSSHEELQVANEELQSTNEELKTSREEMQSMNEELVTVNVELQNKNEHLTVANNDLHNLLRATRIATIFLDTELRIKSFTPSMSQIMNLIATDEGRPLNDLASKLHSDSLVNDAQEVLEHLMTKEIEVETTSGDWYNMRLIPYRTVDNVIDGVVITFSGITDQKQVEAELRRVTNELKAARDYAENIVDTVPGALLVLDADLRVVSANEAFYRKFQLSPEQTVGHTLNELAGGRWQKLDGGDKLPALLDGSKKDPVTWVEGDLAAGDGPASRLSARRLQRHDGATPLLLVTFDEE
jgi:two-component system, chemotaxis family, CheB/CheR fusion protein